MQANTEHLYDTPAPEQLKKFQNFLKRVDKRVILKQLPDLHEAAFEKIDCLDCARCCKNYSPRFKMPDIKRISKYMGMKETAFIDQYLSIISTWIQIAVFIELFLLLNSFLNKRDSEKTLAAPSAEA